MAADSSERDLWSLVVAALDADPGIALSTRWLRASPEFKVVYNRATEGTRGVHASRWNVESVVARAFATASVYYGDLCEDCAAENLTA